MTEFRKELIELRFECQGQESPASQIPGDLLESAEEKKETPRKEEPVICTEVLSPEIDQSSEKEEVDMAAEECIKNQLTAS